MEYQLTDYRQQGGGYAALIRAIRTLDQGDIETTPSKLDRVWEALSQHRGEGAKGGGYHAAEEMLLRWILKNMTGSSAAAERLRRFPPAWDIMGTVFDWIPHFSLAKALADRRFVGILQQTLKELSKPQDGALQEVATAADSDVEMADAPTSPSRKRKRSAPVTFDLALQRQTTGCLKAAEAVLTAIRTLLARCESIPADEFAANHRMGAEHIKSLFSSSATEAMDLLVPIMMLCGLAVDNDTQDESSAEQASWMSTFTTIWGLHLRGATDASEVAKHLSGLATSLLGKLTGIPEQTSLSIDSTVQQQWTRDLRLFLTRNMVLPSRSAFVDKSGQEILQVAVDMSSATFTTSFPVLFDLVSKLPRVFGDMTSKKDYETWMQAAFDALISAMKPHGKQALSAVETIIEMAAERELPLSLTSLREVCKEHALQTDGFAWKLLLSIIKLNPDVFLISADGQELLSQILEKTKASESMSVQNFDKALQFVVLLAQGYARARDLSTFLKTWLQYLVVAEPKVKLNQLWAQKELISAVASVLQESLSTKQLLDIIEWLSTRTDPGESLGRIHILAAISSGVSDTELVDMTNMKTFDGAFMETYSKKEPSAISVSRWLIAENALSRGTQEEATQVWSQVKADVGRTLKKSTIAKEGTFAAFKCCVAAWLANYRDGADVEEAASMTCAFLERLEKDTESETGNAENLITKGTYLSWILSGNSRLVTLLAEKYKEFPRPILGLVQPGGESGSVSFDTANAAISSILDDENENNSEQIIRKSLWKFEAIDSMTLTLYACLDRLIDQMIAMLDPPSKGPEAILKSRVAVQFLLGVSTVALTRPQRETIMGRLITQLPEILDLPGQEEESWKPVLSLMRKLMAQPTFYPDMSFGQLDNIGKRIFKVYRQLKEKKSTDGISKVRNDFVLLGEVAALVIQQMDSGNPEGREKEYLEGAVSVLKSSCKESDMVPRIVLLHAFISTIQGSTNLDKLKEGGLDVEDLKTRLLQGVKPVIELGKWRGKTLLALLTALKAADVLGRKTIRKSFASAVPSLVKASQKLLQKNSQTGWEVRMFLARYFVEELGSPLKIKFNSQGAVEGEDEDESVASVDKSTILQYVEVAVRDVVDATKLQYLEDLLREESEDRLEERSRLFVIRTLLQHLAGECFLFPMSLGFPSNQINLVARGTAIATKSGFDLAQAHTMLCKKLSQTSHSDPEQFILVADTLQLLLDQKGVCMTQWNIDLTLSTVSTICSAFDKTLPQSLAESSSSSNTYKPLCALVEIIIKRHRKRLDGHFHLLITALQALLRHLLLLSSKPSLSQSKVSVVQQKQQERNAALYSRLLTLICEPTVASVTRHQRGTEANGHAAPLDSEKDRAKRYAGQFMYLIVMHYIRLQLQLEQTVVVGGEAREALETGMFSILDITSKPDGLRILSDAMDGSGRVIFRELYRRYERLGKWSGV